jgi:hypothetical protein
MYLKLLQNNTGLTPLLLVNYSHSSFVTIINMKTLIKCLLFASFVLYSMNSYSQSSIVGCSSTADNYVYYIAGPTGYAYPNFIGPSRLYDPTSTSCPRFTGFTGGTSRCCINGVCDTRYLLYTFNNIDCPIDSYVIALLFITGFLGFFNLRKLGVA